ncbi:MAG: 1-acyl-sn-glycerol-3-phosphate acyltransferase [Planctomycetes bacterium]|nr:1-acyl-sn-glycerol-3-phosphate acyltransferase [Planctomycetota bacterium]
MQSWQMQPARDLEMPLLESFGSLHRENGLVATGLNLCWRALMRAYLAVWHRLEVQGREHVPRSPPFVLVANHASHLDALVLGSPLKWDLHGRVFPIAAGDVFFASPVRSALAALVLNALPMWRKNCGRHAMQQLRQRLVDEPCGYILFPEGGRSRDGSMRPFKTGLGMLVAGTSVPVIPCHLSGTFDAMQPGRMLPLPRKIRLRIGQAMTFLHNGNNRPEWERIVAAVEERVRQLA